MKSALCLVVFLSAHLASASVVGRWKGTGHMESMGLMGSCQSIEINIRRSGDDLTLQTKLQCGTFTPWKHEESYRIRNDREIWTPYQKVGVFEEDSILIYEEEKNQSFKAAHGMLKFRRWDDKQTSIQTGTLWPVEGAWDFNASPVFRTRQDCQAVIWNNPGMCQSTDCRGVVYKASSMCAHPDCRAMALGNQAHCLTRDCRAVMYNNYGLCDSLNCRAVIMRNAGLCR